MSTVLALEGSKSQQLFDALPYTDTISDEAKANAERLIDLERAKMQSEGVRIEDFAVDTPALASYLQFKRSKVLQGEMKRIESGNTKMAPLDDSRMSLAAPRLHDQQNADAWKSAAQNSHAQLEHQYHRIENFKLAIKFGSAVWKAHNARTDVYLQKADKCIRETKDKITKLNQSRKLQQEKAKKEMDRLNSQYRDLVNRNIEIAIACARMENESLSKQIPSIASTSEGGEAADARCDEFSRRVVEH